MRGLLWILCIVVLLTSSCASGGRYNRDSLPAAIEHVVPRYAEGFDWKLMADSSIQITLFNLESEGDTLQMINWKPRDIERLASLSTTHVPFMEMLGCLDILKGVGFADRLPQGDAKNRFSNGEMLNLTSGNELEPEVVFSIQPDLLFVYPFGGKSYDKFLSKGIGCVQVSEYLERHPLGRAEWIRLFGCLLGRQAAADSVFAQIEREYCTLRDSIASGIRERPVVFTGSMDGDRWAVPPANSYMATLIFDAGGKYLFSDSISGGNLVLPFESFFEAASKADYWGKIIYEPKTSNAEVITHGDDRLRSLPSFKNQKVFACNALLEDYHGKALLEPHLLLHDLSLIFSEDTLSSDYHYFRPWINYD